MSNESMGAGGVLLRIGAALALVLLTFNPGGFSYAHWVAHGFPHVTALEVVAGLALVIGWAIYVTATLRSLGVIGVLLLLALFAALLWLAIDSGWLALASGTAMAWLAVFVAGLVLGVGMCWSFVRRRLSGQADVDEVRSH